MVGVVEEGMKKGGAERDEESGEMDGMRWMGGVGGSERRELNHETLRR